MKTLLALIVAGLVAISSSVRAEPAWVNISDPLVASLTEGGKKLAWPGQTAGVTCDRTTGDVFLAISGAGLFKSSDQGKTFTRCDGGAVGGRCETAYSINADPAGKRMACFMLDGKAGMTLDGGATWSTFKDVGRNWDYAAVDWSAPKPTTIFAMRHEWKGQLLISKDAGASWTVLEEIGKLENTAALGVADEKTLLLTKGEGILRSTDQGANWTKVSEITPVGRVMVSFKGAHYWLARDPIPPVADTKKQARGPVPTFLIVSKDAGATWTKQGTPTPDEASWGPYFGKDERHLITLNKKGMIIETRDGGDTWAEVTKLPEIKGYDTNRPGWFTNIAYDPTGDVFYVSKMGMAAMKFTRGK